MLFIVCVEYEVIEPGLYVFVKLYEALLHLLLKLCVRVAPILPVRVEMTATSGVIKAKRSWFSG